MPSQILMFDQPRSASQLLGRILSKQASLDIADNALGPARGAQVEWLMGETWSDGMPKDLRSAFDTGIEKGLATWRSAFQDAQDKGRILLLQDHPFSTVAPDEVLNLIHNPSPTETELLANSGLATLLPDDLLFAPGTVPVLTIRDPRLAVPSAYRVLGAMGLAHGSGRPNFLISTSTLWARRLYEACRARGLEPVVVDADDLMTQGAPAPSVPLVGPTYYKREGRDAPGLLREPAVPDRVVRGGRDAGGQEPGPRGRGPGLAGGVWGGCWDDSGDGGLGYAELQVPSGASVPDVKLGGEFSNSF
ncbi:hypothetical protein PG996_006644 [Apiospora saccharicola]|uniref:Uncharacterized protein n=1 Tax=Apiospora saccharicola TaxID=335842 RepID=A0ABR1V8K3_9PEZI